MPFDEPIECPLCMEPLDIDDLNFYPCTCGYQICRFCWHRIRTDENSLCPACRKQYQEDPAEFKPLTDEELTKIKKERRQKDVARKQKAAENRRHLANIRVVQKNLVFVVGLSGRLADPEVLKRQDYFGKYGKILKVVINSSTSYAGAQGPSASAYITYTKPEDCLRAIHAVNNLFVDGRTLKASLGTTKYCSHFLKGTQCTKTDCMYLHELGDEEASFTKEEMQADRHQDYEQKLADNYLTPLTPNPAHTSHISNASRPMVADSTQSVNNGNLAGSGSKSVATAPQRKKTDSGSSNGSSKPKEPWPLLSSNRNSNQANAVQLSKDTSEAVIGQTDTPGETKHNHSNTAHNPTDGAIAKMNGTTHSSPSSNCSTSSNPRTPTPETAPSISPIPPSAITLAEKPPSIASNTETATAAKTILVARKLPFSEKSTSAQNSPGDSTVHPSFVQINSYSDNGVESLDSVVIPPSAAPQTQTPVTGALAGMNREGALAGMNREGALAGMNREGAFAGMNREVANSLLTLPVSAAPDWPTTYDHGAVASDDDLGFDPFMESNKGLADMLENETGQRMPLTGYGGIGLPLHPLHRPPPGVGILPAHLQQSMPAGTDMFGAGIMSSIVAPSSPSVVSCSASTLPPPPPGLSAFPHYSHDTGLPTANAAPRANPPTGAVPDLPAYRGSRMLGLMNLGPAGNTNHQLPHIMTQQSPVNAMPRSPYTENRMGSAQPSAQNHNTFPGGYTNGMTDYNASFNTQELRDSLKALLPNASINFAVAPSSPLQHSRLRNSYMPPAGPLYNNTSSWNGNITQPQIMTTVSGGNGLDDQFTDPAIVSGCLSSDTSNSPARTQPHWLKSIQQLTEIESSPPIKQPPSTQPMHSMTNMPSLYRQPATHSRMPFAQNIHMSQPGTNAGGWPTLQAHNPPPGFPSAFRSTTQNPHITTLES